MCVGGGLCIYVHVRVCKCASRVWHRLDCGKAQQEYTNWAAVIKGAGSFARALEL